MGSSIDIYLFHRGEHREIYNYMGAHPYKDGYIFRTWAPSAKNVEVVGDFNNWTGKPMNRINLEGIWEIYIENAKKNQLYKFKIQTVNNVWKLKSDPYSFYSELRPKTASIIYGKPNFSWTDNKWMKNKNFGKNKPLNIYEVHLGSWKKNKDEFLNYREIAVLLTEYVKKLNYNAVEILPIHEYPLDDSWGYQGTGYYSVTSRHGSPEDFMYFVNYLHKNSIGIILDWVPGHFCKDDHGLYMYDGAPLYEHNWKLLRENDSWGTANFDFSRNEVRSFLISNAIYWLKEFHIDGLRIDAVANIIYLDYGKNGHPELKNEYGENINLSGINFLRELNRDIKKYVPRAITIAEESTSWYGVTKKEKNDGLGFDFKWNMGWMNDTLNYMETDPLFRGENISKVTFPMMYAFSEKYILPFSHDEVVHGKKSLLNKIPGRLEEKIANLKSLYGYLMTIPGKKLSFMGNEIAHHLEWRFYEELEWNLEKEFYNSKFQNFIKDLNLLYLNEKSLWENDWDWNGFKWIDGSEGKNNVFIYMRKGKSNKRNLIVVLNFSGNSWEKYRIGIPMKMKYKEILNSDGENYGGNGKINKNINLEKLGWHNLEYSTEIQIPAFSVIILKGETETKE
ncbi:MAG: 1,4-alpha-glucan branching protein GlgB [Cetobacterium sp.]|uniref:1,4-alpha-glucan branching protein GlgB n=1 Tax=Cetobacterium sp. TaxID=2071632 RepID=UPI003F318C4D